jgi:UDP-glucose 4-epimerase
MNFMVTGSSGYIGSHLVQALEEKYPKAHIFEVDKEIGRCLINGFEVEYDQSPIFDAVFHLAAHSNVVVCDSNPYTSFVENVQMTRKLLDAMICGNFTTKSFIFASSGAVYQPSSIPHKEIDKAISLEHDNTYAVSKLVCEDILRRAKKEFGLKTISLRLGNVAGEVHPLIENHDPETHLIPNLINAIKTDRQFNVYGSFDQIRDYIFVGDVVDAFIKAYEKLSSGNYYMPEVVNIGTGKGHSINDVILAVEEVYKDSVIVNKAGYRTSDRSHLVLDSTLAKISLDFTPKYDLRKIIRSYVI